MYIIKTKLALFVQVNFIVAIAAIHRSISAGHERYFGFLATLGTYYREHLSPVTVATTSVTLCFPGLAACWTALRLVSIAFRGEELLFPSAESEGSSAIGTLERFVLEAH